MDDKKVPVREGTFREGPDGPVLLGNQCKSCGQVFFPKAQTCLTCFGQNLDELALSQRGELYTYAIGHMPSLHFQPPYAIGYINLPEGVRVFAPLVMQEEKPFRIGMEMEVVIKPLWQDGDKEIIGYKFMPL
ncbi:MAG: OB-fold domain-containing protein [Candidatus Margulisiibacteriota bacterium]